MATLPHIAIIRSRRRSIALEVTKDGKIIVKAPLLVPTFFINQFLREKEDWITTTWAKVQKFKKKEKKYIEGETYLFLGKEYVLTFAPVAEIVLKEDKLLFPQVLQFRIQKELAGWFIRQATDIITKRVQYHSAKMKAQYASIFFSDTKSKWGTCFPDNSLQFNWRLVMAPLMVLDYVVIHELTHTTEKHHQAAFWSKVRLYTPAYRQHRKWLDEHMHLLTV